MKMASNSTKLNFLNRLRFTGCKENYLRALFMKSSVTVFEMPMKRFPIKFVHWHTEEESENNTQTESGCTQGRGRGGTRPHGRGHTTLWANQRRGARGTRGGGIERRASAGGGSR